MSSNIGDYIFSNATGLTEEKLRHLEQIFKEAVGDKEEIDLNRFKTIVQSKNVSTEFFYFYLIKLPESLFNTAQ